MKNTMKCLVAVFIMAMAFAVTGITAEAAGVTGLKQTDDYTTSVDVQFTTLNGYEHYGVQVSTNNTFTNIVYQKDTPNYGGGIVAKEAYITGLQAGTTYYVRVGYGTTSTNCFANWSNTIDVVTRPSELTVLKWIDSKSSSVSIQFYAPGANYYAVERYVNGSYVLIGRTTATAVEITNSPGGYYYVTPLRVSSAGYIASAYGDSVKTELLSTKIAKKDFGLSSVDKSSKKMSVGANYYGTGYEVQVQNAGSSKYNKKATTTSTYAKVSYKANRYLKYRVRAYVDTDAGRKYGSWSDYRAFAAMSGKYTEKYKSVYLKWSKVKGSGKIKVQVSTKRDSKYKTFKTLKGSAKSVTVNKYGKKSLGSRKFYYVKITPMVKIGKKYVASDYYLRQYVYTR